METHFPSLPIIDVESFTQAAESGSVVVILLWTLWAPTSRSLDASLQQTGEGRTNLRFYAMDLDQEQNWPLAREWGVMTTPTLVCLFNGVLHGKQVGLRPELQMRAKLTEWNRLSDESPVTSHQGGHALKGTANRRGRRKPPLRGAKSSFPLLRSSSSWRLRRRAVPFRAWPPLPM